MFICEKDYDCVDCPKIYPEETCEHWIEVKQVSHGHWINAYPDIEPNPMFMYGICSMCGFEQSLSDKLNYCPNCGAKMDG